MNYRLLAYAAAPAVVIAGLVGANIASAHGLGMGFGFGLNATPDQIAQRQTAQFQNEATLLGVSVDDVKAAWAKGESMQQLMKDKGIAQATVDANMKMQRQAQMKAQLDALVAKGVITQDQENQRLQFLQTLPAQGRGRMGGMMGGFRGGFGRFGKPATPPAAK